MAAGPIPWKDIILFGQFAGLDDEMLPAFVKIIRVMDNVWLTWQGKKKTENV